MIGQTLGHYRIIERIGSGAMGVVYRARDERLARDVAVKIIAPEAINDRSHRARFRKEAFALSRLSHPNIETVHDFDHQDGVDFLVVEYIPGSTLKHVLSEGPLLEREVCVLGAQLADGLAAAHAAGVVHRDLKPGNLLITTDKRLKILDFGLAKLLRTVADDVSTDSLTQTELAGTLPYMAPEQVLGKRIDQRTDVYALGAVLYEMLTGVRPFSQAPSSGLLDAILHERPKSPRSRNARLSPEVTRIVLKCLEKEAEDRYQSAKEVAIDLRRSVGTSANSPVVEPSQTRRSPVGKVLAALLFLALLAWTAHQLWSWLKPSPLSSRPQVRSLAVLPLMNVSHDPEQEYLTDGLTNELITALGRIGAVRVISHTSVVRFKGSTKSLPEIARMLSVDAILEGSASRAGDRVHVTARLVHAATDQEMWAETYDRNVRDMFALQDDVARSIAHQVEATVTQPTQIPAQAPVNPGAYEAYLKGRYFWNKRTPAALGQALKYFKQAIEIDPNYSSAYAGLADTYALGSDMSLPANEVIESQKSAALRALELDDTLAEAHNSLAAAEWNEWHWRPAEDEYKKAIGLNPNYATAHHWYSIYLSTIGRHDEAIQEARTALTLDPLSLIINANYGGRFFYARRFDEAVAQCRKTLDMDPNFAIAHECLGISYVQQRKSWNAIDELSQAVRLSKGDPVSVGELGFALAKAGKSTAAMKIVNQLERRSPSSKYPVAMIYAGLGQKQKALHWLEVAFAHHEIDLLWVQTEPAFDPLRSTASFQDLIRRIGFPSK